VRVITGDTDNVPYGGGTWASRAAGIGGEAAWQAGKALRANVLSAAASILQADPQALDIRAGVVVDADTGRERMELEDVARIVYFRPDTLPPDFQAELLVTRHYVPRAWPFAFTNGVQASYLEVDTTTGVVTLLKHWCVEDCGTVINPQLVDEQIRGGIVQGIGAALLEHCVYDDDGQLLNGNMMDYLVGDGARHARYRGRPRGDADYGFRAWRQGRRRSRHCRGAGVHHERGQRRVAPARRRADRGNADHAGARTARTRV
jgi:carbon-monoxide dehydrogenase large subunit